MTNGQEGTVSVLLSNLGRRKRRRMYKWDNVLAVRNDDDSDSDGQDMIILSRDGGGNQRERDR